MVNIEYLKEHNLYDAHKHFLELTETYIPIPEDIEEDDNDQDPNAMPQQDGGMEMQQDGNNAAPMDTAAPNADGGPQQGMGGMDDSMPSTEVPSDGPMQNGMDATQDDTMAPMGDEDPLDDGMEPQENDGDTIDIDGLTKAQDKLNNKQNHIGQDLGKVDDKITSLIDKIQSLQSALDSNNSEIESLKAEFEKRNPTQTEKLNLRSLDSYPYNVKPTDYWSQKAAEGGYEAYADNDQPTIQEYEITNDDVDHPSQDIAKSFFNIEDDDIQTLEKLFGA